MITIALINRLAYASLFASVVSGYFLVAFIIEYADLSSFTRAITIPFRALVFFLSLIVIYLLFVRRLRFYRGNVLGFLLLFWFVYSIRLIFDTQIDPEIMGIPYGEYYLMAFGVCFLPMMALLGYVDNKTIILSYYLILIMLSIGCFLALLKAQSVFYTDFYRFAPNQALNPIALGHKGVSLVLLSGFALLRNKSTSYIAYIFLLLAFLMGLSIVGLAASRSPVVALIVTIPLLLWSTYSTDNNWKIILFVATSVIAIPLITQKVTILGSGILTRLENTSMVTTYDPQNRLYQWKAAWQAFLENPITGHSLEGPLNFYPHNLLIESFMATGILGGMLFTLILVGVTIQALIIIKTKSEYSWIALLFLQSAVVASFSGSIYGNSFFWTMLAAVLSIRALQKNSMKIKLKNSESGI